jgi:hypothetical protein
MLHPKCNWCGQPSTVPHHPRRKGGYTETEYISLVGAVPLCKKCHFAIKMHLKLCPICKQNYYKPNKRKKKDRCLKCFLKTPFGQIVNEHYQKMKENKK